MRKAYSIRLFILFAIVLFFGACTPNLYQQPINDFSESVEAAHALLDAYKQDHEKRLLQENIETITKNKLRLSYPEDNGLITALNRKDISLQINTGQKMMDLADKLTRYAKSLSDIVNSESSEAVEAEVGNLAASISAFSGKKSGSKSSEIAGELLSMISGKLLEKQRVDALKFAISRAEPMFPKVSNLLKTYVNLIHEGMLASQKKLLGTLVQKYNTTRMSKVNNKVLLYQITEESKRMKRMKEQNPAEIIDKMVGVHKKMFEHITSGKIKLAEVITGIKDLNETLGKAVAHP